MNRRKGFGFTIVATILGFMLAIQFQTIQEPEIRDTRDTWEIRGDLLNELQSQSKLVKEIRSIEENIAGYKTELTSSKGQVLKETLEELKQEAGLTEVKGPGIVLTISPVPEAIVLGEKVNNLSPELLKRLINELNMYDAEHISVNGQRVINTTVIRDINGETKIDGYPLTEYPIEIKVIAEDAAKLRDRLKVSESIEEFFIDNLEVDISSQPGLVTIPAYKELIRIRHMEPALMSEKGGNT
ncbi:NgoFVII family restriction endonuclease [Bacillus sp. M6-12]|uniref:DUF881 domain-containing protein n=1 Tax=Bacillus sp. M6-12 TaxID=2054166 RepID=UPI000C776E92|nr:DUF881 domain-containing protein [Bacillus sp. M6-12]PLS16597.1 NgoFVII family restriction endonuclease [Bacillus sp. M6-12]